MANRNPVKQLFITFPHSNVDKVTFRDDLLRFEPDYYKVVEEKHKDGTPHLHAIVRFKNKYSKTFVVNYFKEKYPDDYKRIDVKPVRSIKNSIAYLSKEDTEPLESGEFESNRNPQRNWLNKLAREYGYTDLDDLVVNVKKEDEYMVKFRKIVFERWNEYRQYEDYPPYLLNKMFEKIISGIPILKDDITYFMEQLNIKYNESTGEFF